jgi:hypothetical protein
MNIAATAEITGEPNEIVFTLILVLLTRGLTADWSRLLETLSLPCSWQPP